MRAMSLTDREKVLEEVARYARLSDEDRWREMQAACAASAKILAARADRDRVLAFVDPLPSRSKEILAALRARASGVGASGPA
jgi:hypothetical protein